MLLRGIIKEDPENIQYNSHRGMENSNGTINNEDGAIQMKEN